MEKLFGRKTIKGRIMWYNFCLICIIAVIFSVSSYVTANRKTVELARNSLIYHVESIAYRYQMAYEEMLNIVLNCTEISTFDLSQLGDLDTPAKRRKGLEYVKLAGNFCAVTGYGQYIEKLSIFNERGQMVQSGTALSSRDDAERICNASWFGKELGKNIEDYHLDLETPVFYQASEKTIPIVRPLSFASENEWVALFLSTSLYRDELDDNDSGNEMIVTTHSGEQIASLHEHPDGSGERESLIREILASGEKKSFFTRRLHGREYMIAYEQDSQSGILMMELLDMETLKNDRMLILQTIVLIFMACILLGLVISNLFGSRVNRPIGRLVAHIGRIAEGEFAQDHGIESEDEIGMIGKVVNDMAGQIEHLMNQRLEDEKEKGKLELQMLQAQINPHFLYNTLDSIKWIAVIQKNSGIVKVVTALSGLLKNMAKGFHEKVTLEKELEFVQDYITIEKLKYVELFDVNVRIDDPRLTDAKIIKLTLQPLVENAIFSGIEPGGKNGIIDIHIYQEDGFLYAKVRDNGVGIPPDKIPHLLENQPGLKGDRMSSIGLANVDRRIKLTYGEEYGLSIDSRLGEYTEITVRIPVEYPLDYEERNG